MKMDQAMAAVKEYYGKVLQSNKDLKTSACCPIESIPENIKPLLEKVHTEVQEKFYGCGSPIPPVLSGRVVLDLGCGTGRDVYVISQLVGEKGHVYGVDMTPDQLAIARKHQQHQAQVSGFERTNVTFLQGEIENLATLGIKDESVDVVVSNCVINLSSNKEAVFREIFRVLKPGGELYFSDVFASRRIPQSLQNDPILKGECLSGALYQEDFRRLLQGVKCHDFRIVSKAKIALNDKEIEEKLGMVDFYSVTIRTFKSDFEDRCENYGHVAYYQGNMPHMPHAFTLDDHHVFKKGLPVAVCGNTAKMLSETRYKEYFKVLGDFSTHYGLFECGNTEQTEAIGAACC